MKYQSVLELIGKTPHLRLNNFFPQHEVWIKLERQNPGASIKDRIGLAMIEEAELAGILKKGMTIIEPTSGNTGIGLAMVSAVKGYKLILVMPESMSIERRKILAAYGASFELTAKEKGMKGAMEKANELLNSTPNSWMPKQFENPSNIAIHQQTTAQEIIEDFPDGLDYLVTGVGTGGHLTGCARALKEKYKNLKVFAVEPQDSPVISGGNPGPHPIQGIGAGFIPKNLQTDLLDGVIQVTKEEAFQCAQMIVKKEGLFCGISTGASLAAVLKKLPEFTPNSKVLTFNYDTGERYLSMPGLFDV